MFITKTNMKTTSEGTLEDTVWLVTRALQREGFGVLTRIDLDKKIQEKLGKSISPTVVLGACAPEMAHEAFTINSDVASLLPCNVVVRKIADDEFSVEIAMPSALLGVLHDDRLSSLAVRADEKLRTVLRLVENAHAYRKQQESIGATINNLAEECWDREGRWGLCADAEISGKSRIL